jgi:hypothetical protein
MRDRGSWKYYAEAGRISPGGTMSNEKQDELVIVVLFTILVLARAWQVGWI